MRTFDFDAGTDLGAAIRVIREALRDEGRTLVDHNGKEGRIYSVRIHGHDRVIVPANRIA